MPAAGPATHGLPPRTDEAAIAALARETDTDLEVVRNLYDEEFAVLHARASIKNFIGIIAARRVRERLVTAHKRNHSAAGMRAREIADAGTAHTELRRAAPRTVNA